MAAGIPYLGCKISLISKSEIRYEGILYTIDTNESTVALAKVRSFGTEDRPTDRPVAPRDEVYEYIIFRGSDIKDIRVCHPPKPRPTLQGGLPNDPAIVQHSAINTGSSSSGPFGASVSPSGSGGAAPSSAAPGSGRGQQQQSGFGPIGSAGFSAPGGPPFSAAPGAPIGGPNTGEFPFAPNYPNPASAYFSLVAEPQTLALMWDAHVLDLQMSMTTTPERYLPQWQSHQTLQLQGENPKGTSPVDLLRDHSGESSPTVGLDANAPTPGRHPGAPGDQQPQGFVATAGGTRGGRGEHRGGRGGQAGSHQQQQQQQQGGGHPTGFQRNGAMGNRGAGNMVGGRGSGNFRGSYRGGRGGFVPGRPTASKKETLKFDSEYDFEQANEEFQEVLQKLQKTSVETTEGTESGGPGVSGTPGVPGEGDHNPAGEAEKDAAPTVSPPHPEDGEVISEEATGQEPEHSYYDKKKSFFDSISCEALERSKGKMQRPDWREEKKLNKETFGVPGNHGGYRGRGRGGPWSGNRRGGYYGGYRGGSGGGGAYFGGGYNNGFFNYGGGGRFSRDQRGRGGGGNGRGGGHSRNF